MCIMTKRLMFLTFVMFLLLCSIAFAGPFRDVVITVSDPCGVGVENANVSMYVVGSDFFNYSNLTDSDGVVVFRVDARINVPYSNNIPMVDGFDPGVVVPFVGSSEVCSSDCDRSCRSLYYNRTFFFDVEPTVGSMDFIAVTFNRSFKLDQDHEFGFVVSDGSPVVNLPEFSINELNDSLIVLDLEDFIVADDFDDLIISLDDVSWSAVDGSIDIVDDELIVDFFPLLDLVFHQDNVLSFTVVVDDGDTVVSQDLVWDYSVDHRALKGSLVRMYDSIPIVDYDLFVDNDVGNVFIDDEEFVAFFDYSVDALINVTADDYYLSAREIRLTEFDGDVDLDFTVAPVQIDPDLNDDRYELAFDETFRSYSATIRYYEPPTVVICDYPYYENYNPSAVEVQMAVDAVNWLDEFTDDFYVPVQGENLLIVNTLSDCEYYYSHEGVMSIYWDPTLPFAGGNTVTPNADYTIHHSRVLIKNAGVTIATYLQEVFQAMGPTVDNNYFNSSIFCEDCTIPYEPTSVDLEFGHRQHSRQTRNQFNDIDYYFVFTSDNVFTGRNVYYEVREASDVSINGEKMIASRLLGYLKKGDSFIDARDLLKSVPKGVKIIESPKMRDEVRVFSKYESVMDEEKINKIEKLFVY